MIIFIYIARQYTTFAFTISQQTQSINENPMKYFPKIPLTTDIYDFIL